MMRANRRRRWSWWAMVLTLALTGCTHTPGKLLASAGGIGGTGVSSGIGGTGISGVGGTGISAFGRVQGFGSVFVNGREYPLSPRTRITVDGRPATQRTLRVGNIVALEARLNPATGKVHVVRLRSDHALLGKVDAVNPGAHRLTMLGQTVRIEPSTRLHTAGNKPLRLAALRRGDLVTVSGLQRAGGTWSATRLTRLYPAGRVPASAPFVLNGRITRLDLRRGMLQVAGTRVDVAHATRPGRIHAGQTVRIRGYYRNARLHAVSLRLAHSLIGRPGDRVEMEGYIQARPGRDELISNGVLLRYGRSTTFSGGAVPNLTRDRLLTASGTLRPDGSIEVHHFTVGHEITAPALLRGNMRGEEHGESGAERREQPGMPSVEHPGVERPEIEKPDIQRPDIEKPDMGGMDD